MSRLFCPARNHQTDAQDSVLHQYIPLVMYMPVRQDEGHNDATSCEDDAARPEHEKLLLYTLHCGQTSRDTPKGLDSLHLSFSTHFREIPTPAL
jgi:hypothetical protein